MPMKKTRARILIVDDALFIRKTLSQFLSEHDYEIAGEAADGLEGVRLYASTRPDLVLMDISMPNLDGIRAVKAICRMDPRARIIMISAMGQRRMVTESVHSGAKSFIVKPFTPEKVLQTVEKVLVADYAPVEAEPGLGVLIRNVLVAGAGAEARKLAAVLRREEYSVVDAASGAAAIEALEDSPIDLIVMASRFGEVPATELARKIKADDLKRHAPMIMYGPALTGGEVHDLTALGVERYLVEPLDLDKVRELIAELDAKVLDALAPADL